MSISSSASAVPTTMLAQIQQLNEVMEQAILTKTDHATRLAKLAASQQIEDHRQAASGAALDVVV